MKLIINTRISYQLNIELGVIEYSLPNFFLGSKSRKIIRILKNSEQQDSKVLFWHTGGIFNLFNYHKELGE